LRNQITGGSYNLELDCFNSELKLAVEYNGIQHYKFVPYFHRNKEHFQNQQYRDYMKENLCRDNNINLISVPYTVKLPDIKYHLVSELKKIGYKI